MCNLYSQTKGQAAIVALTRALRDSTGNLPPLPGIFPDYQAPVVANRGGIRELCMMRWGMPSSQKAQLDAAGKRADKLRAKGKPVDFGALLRMEPDGGITNIRNTSSPHWTRWLGIDNRCVVPFTSFSEFNKAEGGDVWFALDDSRPLAVFAGIWTNWTSVRKVKGRDHQRPVRISHHRAERRCGADPSQGDAGLSAEARRAKADDPDV